MTTYNRYIENNSEIIEVVDYNNPYKSFVIFIHNKKYNIVCDDYYQLLYYYNCENMPSGEIFKHVIPKQYLKFYPDYYEYQDENLIKNKVDNDKENVYENDDEEYDDYENDDENNHEDIQDFYTNISEHSNVRINTNYKFYSSTQKDQYIRQQKKLKHKNITDQIKYH